MTFSKRNANLYIPFPKKLPGKEQRRTLWPLITFFLIHFSKIILFTANVLLDHTFVIFSSHLPAWLTQPVHIATGSISCSSLILESASHLLKCKQGSQEALGRHYCRFRYLFSPSSVHGHSLTSLDSSFVAKPVLASPFLSSSIAETTGRLGVLSGCLLSTTLCGVLYLPEQGNLSCWLCCPFRSGALGSPSNQKQWIFNIHTVIYSSFINKFLNLWKNYLSWLRTPSNHQRKFYFLSSRREFFGKLN